MRLCKVRHVVPWYLIQDLSGIPRWNHSVPTKLHCFRNNIEQCLNSSLKTVDNDRVLKVPNSIYLSVTPTSLNHVSNLSFCLKFREHLDQAFTSNNFIHCNYYLQDALSWRPCVLLFKMTEKWKSKFNVTHSDWLW